jgi:xylitol oxidase
VTTVLHAQGWALHNLGSLPHISVAGACATGTHGSGNSNTNLAGAAAAVEFVRADGELVRLAEGDPSFPGAVLALGALGIITRLTLSIEPAYTMRQDVYLDMPLTVAADNVQDILAAAYSVSLFSDFTRPDVIDMVWLKSRASEGDPPAAPTWLSASRATSAQHPLPRFDPAAASPQLGVVGPWHERLPHFHRDFTPSSGEELQSEYFLPREAAPDVLPALRAVADQLVGPLQVFEMRTVAADDLWLSPCHGRDTVAAHFTWLADLDEIRPALLAVEAALAPFDPRPHWAKVFLAADAAALEAAYPSLPDFRELAAAHDPDRHFGNDFLARYVYGT